MAISVVKYPKAYVLDGVEQSATVSNSAGTALFTKVGHGLTDGDFIYIYSNFQQYNGHWYVNQISVDTFQIREYATATDVTFINSGTVNYQEASVQPWNCVHLPMIYKLKSDLWPINGVDTSRIITTFSNYAGYTYLVLSGDVKSTGTASSLENVVLTGVTGPGGEDISGVYRIIQWFSDTNIVIDLLYSAGNVLSGGACQYYYLNYHAKVKIYAGLAGAHTWAAVKPYELLTTIKVPFDSTGVGTLNVADIVKSKIEVFSNNLQLDTLPANIDACARVYISVAESYDDSDGYTIEEYTSSYTDDTTEVWAINAKLPFKTRSVGGMSDYLWGGSATSRAKFLTPFRQPTLFDGYYFDLSFIYWNYSPNGPLIKLDRYSYSNGNYTLISSSTQSVTFLGDCVYRVPIERTGSEDRIDVQLIYVPNGDYITEKLTIDVVDDCNQFRTTNLYLTWLNYVGGYDYWLFTAQKLFSVDIGDNKTQEVSIYENWPKSYGEFAQSIVKQSSRSSRNVVKVTSQYLTKDQMDALAWIVSSPLVQIVSMETVSGIDIVTQRTVLVDTSTLSKYKDRDNLYSISFNITYTDDLPVQSL